jgi:hypothetical protein
MKKDEGILKTERRRDRIPRNRKRERIPRERRRTGLPRDKRRRRISFDGKSINGRTDRRLQKRRQGNVLLGDKIRDRIPRGRRRDGLERDAVEREKEY